MYRNKNKIVILTLSHTENLLNKNFTKKDSMVMFETKLKTKETFCADGIILPIN